MTKSKYIRFELMKPGGENYPDWEVRNKRTGDLLALIEWYPRWERYVLSCVQDGVLFSEDCLRDIAEFCARQTKDHK